MRIIHTLFLFLALAALPAKAQEAPVVLELYTSQGCSSCPAADRYMEELDQSGDVIALACHVTYWNHLNWQDKLSQKFCDLRQYSYSNMMNRSNVFTPQMILNGTQSLNGTDRAAVEKAIKNTAKLPVIGMKLDGQALLINLPDTGKQHAATLYLFEYIKSHQQDIKAGENRGRNVTYINAVQKMENLGGWDGAAGQIRYDISDTSRGYALIAQDDILGPVVAAGKY